MNARTHRRARTCINLGLPPAASWVAAAKRAAAAAARVEAMARAAAVARRAAAVRTAATAATAATAGGVPRLEGREAATAEATVAAATEVWADSLR